MKDFYKSNLNIWIHTAACLGILFMGCYHLEKFNYIAVLEDEFGYWGTAASMAGYDWTELMEQCSYYAPGYSFLLLPIIIFLPSWLWYKTAILVNVLLLVLTYFISVKVGRRLFPQADIKLIAAAGALTAIYPGNITYATVAWTETLQYFLIWLLTYLLVLLEEKFSYIRMGEMLVVTTYLYYVHNRNIGVMAVLLGMFVLIMRKNRRKLWEYLLPIFFCTSAYFAFRVFRNHEVMWLYGGGRAVTANNFTVSGNMISLYFQRLLDNLSTYGVSVYSKFFYLLLGTGFTFFAAVSQIGTLLKHNILKKTYYDEYAISRVWCVTITVIMLLLTALQMMGNDRKDIIVYSRYYEHTVGPVLFIGIIAVCSMGGRLLRKIMMLTAIFCLPGILTIPAKITEANAYFNSICAPVLGIYYDNTDDIQEAFVWILFTLNLIVIIMTAEALFKSTSYRKIVTIAVLFLVFVVGGFESSTYMDRARASFEAATEPIRDTLIDRNERELYYIVDEENDPNSIQPRYLQYMIPNHKIHLSTREELYDWAGESNLILVYKKDTKTVELLSQDDSSRKVADSSGLILYEINP